jgi:hypothetical protein
MAYGEGDTTDYSGNLGDLFDKYINKPTQQVFGKWSDVAAPAIQEVAGSANPEALQSLKETVGSPTVPSNLSFQESPITQAAKPFVAQSAADLKSLAGEATPGVTNQAAAAPAEAPYEPAQGGYLASLNKTQQPIASAATAPDALSAQLADLRVNPPGVGGGPAGAGAAGPAAPSVQVIKGTNVRNEVPLDYVGMQKPEGAVMSGSPMLREPSRPNVASPENMAIYNQRMGAYKEQAKNLADLEKTRQMHDNALALEKLKGENALNVENVKVRQGDVQQQALQQKTNTDFMKNQYGNDFFADQENYPYHQAAYKKLLAVGVQNPQEAAKLAPVYKQYADTMHNFDSKPSAREEVMANIQKSVNLTPAQQQNITRIFESKGQNDLKTSLVYGFGLNNAAAKQSAMQALGLNYKP